MSSPLISIVIPTYRRPRFLDRAIASVSAQTYDNWELIIVDDNDPGSEGRKATEELLADYLTDPRLHYVRHERNQGGAAARNTGIREAAGESVAFLDDDDEWHPEKLEKQQRLLDASPDEVALVYCGFRKVYSGSGKSQDVLPGDEPVDLARLLKRNDVGTTSAILVRKRALLAVGLFDESLPSKQDVDLYVRLAKRYRLVAVPEVLVTWHRHGEPSIGLNVEGVIRAHQLFYEKHRDEIVKRRDVHHYRLLVFAQHLWRAGEVEQARSYYLRSWRLKPRDIRALLSGLLCLRPLLALDRGIRQRLKRPLDAFRLESAGE